MKSELPSLGKPAEEVRICLPLIRTAMQGTEAFLYAEHGTVADAAESQASSRGILVTPLMGLVGRSIGAIQIDSLPGGKPLTVEDLEQLVVLSHVVAFVLEQVKATEAHVKLEVTRQGTAGANQLQAGLSPSAPPIVPGYRIAHELVAATNVAGDLVDYARMPDGNVACFLIDVPGEGWKRLALWPCCRVR